MASVQLWRDCKILVSSFVKQISLKTNRKPWLQKTMSPLELRLFLVASRAQEHWPNFSFLHPFYDVKNESIDIVKRMNTAIKNDNIENLCQYFHNWRSSLGANQGRTESRSTTAFANRVTSRAKKPQKNKDGLSRCFRHLNQGRKPLSTAA